MDIPDPKKWAHESPEKADYPVPNLGPDQDVIDTSRSIVNAQLVHQRKLILGTPESKEKYHNKAKDVTDYNFAPVLDEDVKQSAKSLAQSE